MIGPSRAQTACMFSGRALTVGKESSPEPAGDFCKRTTAKPGGHTSPLATWSFSFSPQNNNATGRTGKRS